MAKADWIEILQLANEVIIVGEDPGHGMYQVHPAGKPETFSRGSPQYLLETCHLTAVKVIF
jgi:hypothetical protein